MGWAPAAGIPLLWEEEDLTALKATHRSLPKEGERQPSLGGMLAIPAADRPSPWVCAGCGRTPGHWQTALTALPHHALWVTASFPASLLTTTADQTM